MQPTEHRLSVYHSETQCGLCGRPLARSIRSEHEILCRRCSVFVDDGHQQDHERFDEAIKERIEQGSRLGNDQAVEYPHGLDFELTRLLDQLRLVQARVRVDVGDQDDPDSVPLLWDGHLRRATSRNDRCGISEGKLGLFLSPSSSEPLWTFDDEDYGRLRKITCIDPLLLGSGRPKTLWEAPPLPEEQALPSRARRESREWWTALLFVIHLLFVVAVIIGGAIPVFIAASNHAWLDAIVWGSCWWFAGVTAAVILGEVWEPWPPLSRLWRR